MTTTRIKTAVGGTNVSEVAGVVLEVVTGLLYSSSVYIYTALAFSPWVLARNHQADDKLSVFINFCATNFFHCYKIGRAHV